MTRAMVVRGAAVALLLTGAAASAQARQAPAAGGVGRSIPRDGLYAYVEFDGLDRHADAWRGTAAYRMLNETTLGSMLETMVGQSIDGLLRDAPGTKPTGAEAIAFAKGLAGSGFALGVRGKLGGDDQSAILVFRDAKSPIFEKALAGLGMGATTERITREDGRKVTMVRSRAGASLAWWREGADLTVALGKPESDIEAVVETLAGKRPSVDAHPIRLALAKSVGGLEPVAISFVDLADLPPTPPELGLTGLNRIESVWGFRGEALESLVRVVAPAPRKGLLSLMDQPTFSPKGDLGIPAGVTEFSVISLEPAKLYDSVVALARAAGPQAGPAVDQAPAMFRQATGLDLRDDVLARVGPRMGFYSIGDRLTVPTTPYHSLAQWFLHLPKYVMVAETRDGAAFLKTADALATVINRHIEALSRRQGLKGTIALRPLKGGAGGYELDVPLGVFPLPNGVRPGFAVGGGRVVFSTDVAAARALASGVKAGVDPGLAKALDGLPDKLVALVVSDPRESMPEVLANLPFFVQAISSLASTNPSGPRPGIALEIDRDAIPSPESMRKHLFPSTAAVSVDETGLTLHGRDAFPNLSSASAAPVAAALLLPAVRSAREAARRSQSVNNLKQILLAMHNHLAAFGNFPGAIRDGDGKPLLSWRVAILPFIEQEALYKEFHLDEPWDSEHNKKLIERMPRIYASTNVQPKAPFTTFYQTFVGPLAFVEKQADAGRKIQDVTDGTSNTLGVVEAGEAVIWSKPDDVKFDPEKPVPKLGGPGFAGGFNAAFLDGSVRFIKSSIDPDVLKALITVSGGEVVNADDF